MNKSKINNIVNIITKIIYWYFLILGTILVILGYLGYKFYDMPFNISIILMGYGLFKFILGWLISQELRLDAIEEKLA